MVGRGTRFELLTPRGHGGIAVVAVRGDDRWDAVSVLLQGPGGGGVCPGSSPRRAFLVVDDGVVDEVLVVDRPRQQVLELHLHGSPVVLGVLERVVGGFAEVDASLADQLLRHARSPEQLDLALEQRELDLDEFLEELAATPAEYRERELQAALERSRVAMALLEPRRLVICGAQNAGKSTLMNRLVFAERVLTGELPGLTRDPVREVTTLAGYPYEVIDTAGEGGADGDLERRSLELARQERRQGLLLLVVDGSRVPGSRDLEIRNDHTLVVRSKTDLPPASWPVGFCADLELSCLPPTSALTVRQMVGEGLRRLRDLPTAGSVGGVAALDSLSLTRLRSTLERLDGPPGGSP